MRRLGLGINLWNWVLRAEDIDLPLCRRALSLGFDHLEIPVLGLSRSQAQEIRAFKEASGITLSACYSPPEEADFLGDERAQWAARKQLQEAFELSEVMGATILVGPLYNGRRHRRASSREEVKRQRRELALAFAKFYKEYGPDSLNLAIEPINRYRSDLLNTVEDGLEFLSFMDETWQSGTRLGLLFDSYQAQIEEQDVLNAFTRALASGRLTHLHVINKYRLPPDPQRDHFDWKTWRAILAESDYSGLLCLEMFCPGGLDSSMHDLCQDRDQMAIRGLNGLRQLLSLT